MLVISLRLWRYDPWVYKVEGQKFITFMDALKLKYKSKDQLHPHLSDLMASLNTSMPRDFEGRAKIVQWLISLNQMRAADELTEDQSRQVFPRNL